MKEMKRLKKLKANNCLLEDKKNLQKKWFRFNVLSSSQAVRIDGQQVILDKNQRGKKWGEMLKASAFFPGE